jgi:hypothetical protein
MGEGVADNFVTVTSTDVAKKILRLSYKNNSFVHSPVILYDDTYNDYYYSLDLYGRYVLIYTIMNTVDVNTMINPSEYEALK